MSSHAELSGPDLNHGIASDELREGAPLLGHAGGEAVVRIRWFFKNASMLGA
jgi:hypothetical protein